MKKILFAALCCLIFISCGQDPIFYNISIEPPKRDPIIPGSPTGIIVLKNKLYVGNRKGRKVFTLNAAGSSWTEVARPGGILINLATDNAKLYALMTDNDVISTSKIKVYNPDTNSWEGNTYSLSGHSIQTVYGSSKGIFAGSQYKIDGRTTYAILFLGAAGFEIIKPDTALLKGAAEKSGTGIFLATAGKGVFLINDSSTDADAFKTDLTANAIPDTADTNMVGIMENSGNVFAISNKNGKGSFYLYSTAQNKFSASTTGVNLTGAICVWNQHDSSVVASPSVKIVPSLVTVKKGNSLVFSVLTSGLTDSTVTWSLSGNSTGTSINASTGELTVASGETSASLTVTATSAASSSVKGFATVNVVAASFPDGYVTIDGDPLVGNTLTANTSEFDKTGSGTINYVWKRGDVEITTALNSVTYTLVDLDQSENISVTVSRDGIEGSVSSEAVSVKLPGSDPWKPSLLLLGVRGSGNSQGYREILLDRNTGRPPATISLRTPGDNKPSSVDPQKKTGYTAGIAKYPVELILQTPKEVIGTPATEADLPIFAATTLNGLWSYRNGAWNAEQ